MIRKIGWPEYLKRVKALTAMIERMTPLCIMAPARGGLIPGVIVSHALGIPLIVATRVNSLWVLSPHRHFNFQPGGQRRFGIIVDDICDTGATLVNLRTRAINDLKIGFRCATLFAKPSQDMWPSIVGQTITQDVQIQFPYEKVSPHV